MKPPLLGVLGVWNQKSDKSGLQVKLGTAHQVKHATIIRKQVGISEQAEGNTTLTAWNLISELKYNIMLHKVLNYLLILQEDMLKKYKMDILRKKHKFQLHIMILKIKLCLLLVG